MGHSCQGKTYLRSQRNSNVARQPSAHAAVSQRLYDQEHIRWPAAAQARHRAQQFLVHLPYKASCTLLSCAGHQTPCAKACLMLHDGSNEKHYGAPSCCTCTIRPTALKSLRTASASSSFARPPRHIALAVSPTKQGVFGMTRTTRLSLPAASCLHAHCYVLSSLKHAFEAQKKNALTGKTGLLHD